jgi:hypothetical protein
MHDALRYTLSGAAVIGLSTVLAGAVVVIRARKPALVAVLTSAAILAAIYLIGWELWRVEKIGAFLSTLPRS